MHIDKKFSEEAINIYGRSMNYINMYDFLLMKNIDGSPVGKSSMNKEKCRKIYNILNSFKCEGFVN
jgi:triosephosphate isomerase